MVCNITEAKAQLSALVEQVTQGEEVILVRAGKPVARIVPYSGAAKPRKPGSMAGEISISPGFDELPEDMANAFGMAATAK